ncbi:MAG: hypothetical protein AAGF74_02145 [Pseudomonadota bacterium]
MKDPLSKDEASAAGTVGVAGPENAGGGMGWPDAFGSLLPVLRSQWDVGDELYLSRMLGNGRSGALVYAVDVSTQGFTGQAILKLEQVKDSKEQEKLEAALHAEAISDAPDYAKVHLPRLIHTLHHQDSIAILSTIAGRALEYSAPWHDLAFDRQLEVIRHVSTAILEDWNADYKLSSGLVTPQALLRSWLSYRIDPDSGGRIHSFIEDECGITPSTPSIFFNGHWYPNPLAFFDGHVETPERLQLRGALGHCHNDFHGFNLLVPKRRKGDEASSVDYFLIDLAMYEGHQFLLYDHAYFEFTSLLAKRGESSADDWEAAIAPIRRYQHDVDIGLRADDFGLLEIIETVRKGAENWINANEGDRVAFLENQQILARVAVGLNFTHKNMPAAMRKKAFFYAAANLKDYLKFNGVNWPKHGQELIISEERADPVAPAMLPASHGKRGRSAAGASGQAGTAQAGDAAAAIGADQFAPARARRSSWTGWVVAAVVAVFAATIIAVLEGPDLMGFDTGETPEAPVQSDKVSVAVLPFENHNRFTEDNFAQGLTIEVINALAATRQLHVPGYNSAEKFKDDQDDTALIGEQLGVEYVTQGSVTQSNDQVRIVVNLLDAASGDLVWNGVFEESPENVFQAQEALAKAIGAALSVPLDINSDDLVARRTPDPHAYDAYVRGIALLEQRGPSLTRAIAALERAVELEPDFAAAWAALAIAYNILPSYLHAVEGTPVRPEIYYRMSRDAALTALDLDPNQSDVQHAAGNMYQRTRQWVQAERAYLRALELDPSNHRAMQDYGGLLQTVGKPEEALTQLDTALQLDPINDLYHLMRARVSNQIATTEASVAEIERVFRDAPAFREIAFRPILARRTRDGELGLPAS